jgi:hypothetical protein
MTVLIVSIECAASPDRMFARLAPSAYSSPWPSEWRRSSSCASRGWLVTIARPVSFSHQRNAGMSSLLPCRSPAWQAPVCDDQSVSQRSRRCVPSRSQRAMTGALPSRSARRRTSCARPSISRKTIPGTSLTIAPARRAWRRTTLRCHVSSSSMARSDAVTVVMIARPMATATPAPQLVISAPGLIAAAIATSAPLSTIAARPSVTTLSGSARRLSVGHSSALRAAAMSAVTSAPTAPLTSKPGRIGLRISRATQSRTRTTSARMISLRSPGIARSLAGPGVSRLHPRRVTQAHPPRT